MAVKIIEGDLFNTDAEYICHQVNCCGKMGSGVAKQVRARYPEAFIAYAKKCDEMCNNTRENDLLGSVQFVTCYDGKTIVNMFAQGNYGYDGQLYTDYSAFQKCLQGIGAMLPRGNTIAMPYKIGCGLGGGDWDTILGLIEKELPNHTVELWKKDA